MREKFKVGDRVVPKANTLQCHHKLLTQGKIYEVVLDLGYLNGIVKADHGDLYWSMPELAFDKYVVPKNIIGGHLLTEDSLSKLGKLI